MNERIAKIAEDATYLMEFNKDDDILETSFDDISYRIPAEFISAFAELLIRECAGVTLDYKNDEHYNGWCDHATEILQRFGVKP